MAFSPFVLLALALFAAEILHRRNPEKVRRQEQEREEALERELDEILKS